MIVISALRDPAIKPPERPCTRCNCCPGRWHWRKDRGGWWNPHACQTCEWVSTVHGFHNHTEYQGYLNKGCWVCGGTADRVDHDHLIHSGTHSCEQCRRGPACASCNRILRHNQTVADLYERRDHYQILADSLELAAIALHSWKLKQDRCKLYAIAQY